VRRQTGRLFHFCSLKTKYGAYDVQHGFANHCACLSLPKLAGDGSRRAVPRHSALFGSRGTPSSVSCARHGACQHRARHALAFPSRTIGPRIEVSSHFSPGPNTPLEWAIGGTCSVWTTRAIPTGGTWANGCAVRAVQSRPPRWRRVLLMYFARAYGGRPLKSQAKR